MDDKTENCCGCCESPGPGMVFVIGAAILYGAAIGATIAWIVGRLL